MGVKVTNNAYGTLSASISTSDTTITLDSGQGARFPSLSAGDYFYGTLVDTSNNIEVVKVTARSTDSMTVTRGADNTTATAFAIGDRFELRPTAALFESIIDEVAVDGISSSATGTALTLSSSNNVNVANDLNVTSGIVSTPRLDLNNTRNVRMILGGETGANNTDDGGMEFHTDTHFSVYENDDTNHRVLHIATNTGIVHMEKQPAFGVRNNSSTALTFSNGLKINPSWTTSGSGAFIRSGSGFNSSNTRFTAPDNGVYYLDLSFTMWFGSANASDGWQVQLYVNGSGSIQDYFHAGGINNGYEERVNARTCIYLTTNDYVEWYVSGYGGSASIGHLVYNGFKVA